MMHAIEVNTIEVETKTRDTSWIDKYLAYCDSYKDNPLIWYLIPLMTFSTVTIPIVVCILYFLELPYLWVMSFSVLLFYANIIVNLGGWNTRVTITMYWATTLIMFLIPLISYILLK